MRWLAVFMVLCTTGATFAAKAKSGLYHVSIVKITACEEPVPPYPKDPMIRWQAELYSTTTKKNLIRGNVTILQRFKQFSGKFKEFYQQNGKWSLSRVNNQRCNGLLLPILLKSVNLRYDSVDCTVEKGFFGFENIDLDEQSHIFSRQREYGHMLWILQYYMRNTTIACCQVESQVTPA